MAEEVQEEIEVQGPGAMLKARRESLQLSIEEIAEKLHLRPAVVAELEQDVIDHSVSMTFTKGYVRLYAKHLEMDPAPVLAAFDELANPIKQPARLQSFSQRVAKQASDTRLMMLSYFILFAIIAMAVIWWFQQPEESTSEPTTAMPGSAQVSNSQQTPEVAQVDQPTEVSTEIAPESESQFASDTGSSEPVSDVVEPNARTEESVVESVTQLSEPAFETTEQQNSNLIADDNTEDADVLVTEEPQDVVSEENGLTRAVNSESDSNDVARELALQSESNVEASTPNDNILNSEDTSSLLSVNNPVADNDDLAENFDSAEPITQELVFTFEQDCWMNLTDATGENIAYGVKNAGRIMPVSGIPPFEVVLGAPQGVDITVDGVPFDMSAFPAGRTARFIIGEQSETSESGE